MVVFEVLGDVLHFFLETAFWWLCKTRWRKDRLLVRGCAEHWQKDTWVLYVERQLFMVYGDVAGVRFQRTMYAKSYGKLHVNSAGMYFNFGGVCIVHDDVAAIRFQRMTLPKGCTKLNVDSTDVY
ncbi:hypothetical protein Tco_1026237 [Tanacetum coccineum]